ncbi:MAG TPA: hypothetical protein VHX38_27590 [Pseudonocardiaceae bacterium]|nr:hypothetical protein [Pseudonocardiaceae bacterium]
MLAVAAATVAALLSGAVAAATAPPASPVGGGAGSYLLTATNTGSTYAPTFTGNGYLGVRVPPAGQGYAAGTVPAQSEVAGFYAQPSGAPQQRANIPTWSTFTFSDGGQDFAPGVGTTTDWRQQLDLRTGAVTTTAVWTAPNGQVTDLRYVVATDRARANVATVALRLTPRWSGTANVTDLIDGTPADQTTEVAKGWDAGARQDWETVRTEGLGIVAGLASTVGLGAGIPSVSDTPVEDDSSTSVGQQLRSRSPKAGPTASPSTSA